MSKLKMRSNVVFLAMKLVSFIGIICLIFGLTVIVRAQHPAPGKSSDGLWQDVKESSIAVSGGARQIVPRSYRTVRLNKEAMTQLLAQAPMEFTQAASENQTVMTIPMPNRIFARFRIQQSPITLPDPSGKVSDFKTYSGQGMDDRTATVRFDISSAGFHAQILSVGETVYVDPYATSETTACISYYKRDAQREGARPECLAAGLDSLQSSGARLLSRPANQPGVTPNAANGAMLRSFRTALAATGEYTTFFRQAGDTDAQAKARALLAIKTTMNRVNGIWGRDVAVRYVLLADVDELRIIYTDGATDPYTNNDPNALINENQTNLDAVIGDANYDMGHVFATSPGGIGGGGVCVTGQKAMGATGLPMPVGDPFDVDFVAHEIIHQWQGGHTFNESNAGQCTPGNRTPPSAYEPGSGSTVASYAGTCDTANLQASSDDYFHGGSINEILNFATSTATCAVQTATGNTPPAVSAPASFTIPRNTPFTLTATATDPDGDALTYGWEEFDLGNASPPNSDDGTRPIFRPYRPVTSPSRTFPSRQYILNNANNPPPTITVGTQTFFTGEVMPTTTRTMNFRVTVRDNRAGGGGINNATTQVNVRADSGPFAVTAPNTAVTVMGGAQLMVTWDVANTAAAPVSTANVKISLSTDGGNTFPTVLAASTANDGSEAVTLPNVSSNTARIKVEAVGNVFFDISDTNFTITASGPTPTPSTLGNISTRLRVETGDNVLIGGFIITGTQPKRIIVRAIGPSLSSFFPGALADPILELRNSSGGLIASNDNWRSDQEAEIIATTIPPSNDLESAIVATLPANSSAYTAIVRGVNNGTGIGVVEAYDLDRTVDSKLANISTRGFVQTGDNVLIGGLIVLGQNPLRVIVRAIGPSLPLPGALGDPTLELHDGNGALVASNDNWRTDQEAEIIATGIPPTNDLESAIVQNLAPGNYTAIVRGVNNTIGVALVEAYGLN
jgi:hypothetical protein